MEVCDIGKSGVEEVNGSNFDGDTGSWLEDGAESGHVEDPVLAIEIGGKGGDWRVGAALSEFKTDSEEVAALAPHDLSELVQHNNVESGEGSSTLHIRE